MYTAYCWTQLSPTDKLYLWFALSLYSQHQEIQTDVETQFESVPDVRWLLIIVENTKYLFLDLYQGELRGNRKGRMAYCEITVSQNVINTNYYCVDWATLFLGNFIFIFTVIMANCHWLKHQVGQVQRGTQCILSERRNHLWREDKLVVLPGIK